MHIYAYLFVWMHTSSATAKNMNGIKNELEFSSLIIDRKCDNISNISMIPVY